MRANKLPVPRSHPGCLTPEPSPSLLITTYVAGIKSCWLASYKTSRTNVHEAQEDNFMLPGLKCVLHGC